MNLRDYAKHIQDQISKSEETKVRVALFGQPGSGKSSLINALVGQDLAEVGVHTDTTTVSKRYEWEGLILTDLPGYDTEKFPREKYFEQFDIHSFDLFICVFQDKFREADSRFFRDLKSVGKTCLFVRNKSDNLWQRGKTRDELQQQIVADTRKHTGDSSVDVIFTSCQTYSGLESLADGVRRSLSEAKKERWTRTAKAYSESFLEEKRKACEKLVVLMAGLSAANGLNPLPGADLAIDVGVMQGLFIKLRGSYGLSDEKLQSVAKYAPALAPIANQVIEFATREGIFLLLKQFLKRRTLKEIAKYIPFVGQAVAASLGFLLTYQAGEKYLADCHKLASTILEMELQLRRDEAPRPTQDT